MIILHQLEVIILKVITALVNPPMCFICHLLPATKQAILLMAALCLRLDSVQSNIVLGGFGGFGTGAGGAIGVFGCTGDSQKGATNLLIAARMLVLLIRAVAELLQIRQEQLNLA